MVSLMALLSYPQPMRFNYCLGPPPIRSTYQSIPPPWHSHYAIIHFFLEIPLLKIGTFFFHSKRSNLNKGYPQNCIFEKDHHLHKIIHLHKNQPPTGLKKKKKKKKKTAPPPPQNIVPCLQSPPPPPPPGIFFHLEHPSAVVFWCARIHVVQFI